MSYPQIQHLTTSLIYQVCVAECKKYCRTFLYLLDEIIVEVQENRLESVLEDRLGETFPTSKEFSQTGTLCKVLTNLRARHVIHFPLYGFCDGVWYSISAVCPVSPLILTSLSR